MIKKVKYQDIDFDKYIKCLDQSVQKKSYAYPHYLDNVVDKNWEILVYQDYQAVMPIPYFKKLGFKFVIGPKLCQQLGVFSSQDSTEINDLFLTYLQENYAIWYYSFNDVNEFSSELKSRKNFLIPKGNYDDIRQKYSPKRKRKLRLDPAVLEESERLLVNDFGEFQKFMSSNFTGVTEKNVNGFVKIFKQFFLENHLKVYGFKYQNQWVNMIALYEDDYNSLLLGTFNHKDYVKLSGASVLIDDAIKSSVSEKIFDFEGSELPNVEEFFRGFRPELRPYLHLSYSKKEAIIQVVKKFFN